MQRAMHVMPVSHISLRPMQNFNTQIADTEEGRVYLATATVTLLGLDDPIR